MKFEVILSRLDQWSSKLPNLTRVDFSGYDQLEDAGIQALAEKCLNLTHVNFSECPLLTGTGIQALAKNCLRLAHLDLACCKFTDASIKFLAKKCPRIKIVGGLEQIFA
jgi:hypothetical protein